MGNKIKEIFCSLLFTLYFLLFFSELFSLREDIALISSFIILFVLSFLLIKQISVPLHYVLFVSIMPIVTLVVILFVDTTFFEKKIIHNLLKLFSWDIYQGETRSRQITKVLSFYLTPILLIFYSIFGYIVFSIKQKK